MNNINQTYVTFMLMDDFIFRITLKDIKAFLPRLNYKMPNCRLRELFNEVDTRRRLEIGFDDFTILYNKIIFDENVCE